MSSRRQLVEASDFGDSAAFGREMRENHYGAAHDFASGVSSMQLPIGPGFVRVAGSESVKYNLKGTMQTATKYPNYLIDLFAVGLIGLAVGVIGLIIGAAGSLYAVRMTSLVLLAVAVTTVALTLLRGQDLNERA
jgi:hypothetical protein